MKAIKRMLAIVLALVLVCSVAVTALGDTSYTILKSMFTDSSTSLYIGSDYLVVGGTGEKMTMVCYLADDQQCFISGEDESVMFYNVSMVDATLLLYKMCMVWDTISATVDGGYTLVLGMISGEDSIWIDSAQDAAEFVQAVENLIGE